MSLKNILAKVSNVAGLSPDNDIQRLQLLTYINEAAEAVWADSDLNGSLYDLDVTVLDGSILVLPRNVLEIRAMIDNNVFLPRWNMVDLYTKYQEGNRIADLWFNWRDLGLSPVIKQPTVGGVLSYNTTAVEDSPPVVSMGCLTINSDNISEDISMDLVVEHGTLLPITINSLKKNIPSIYNITVKDAAGIILAVIPNNQLDSLYHLFDISTFPWNDTSILSRSMKVLCKKRLPYFQLDNDEFPAPGYDMVVANKALEIWSINNQNSEQAALYDSYAARLAGRINSDQKRGVQEIVAFGSNPHDTLILKPYTLHRPTYPNWYR